MTTYHLLEEIFGTQIDYHYIEEKFQTKKITVLTVMSVGTLVSNIAILLAILTTQSKVLNEKC